MNKRDESTRWSKLKEGTSVAAGVATAVGMLIAAWGLMDAHRATIEANRAWVAPNQMVLTAPLENGQPVGFGLHLVNFGREPALGVTWRWQPRLVPYVPLEGTDVTKFGPNDTCGGLDPGKEHGFVVYPGTDTKAWVVADLSQIQDGQSIGQRILAHSASLVIEGCVAYLTQGERHTSSFRFFLRDVPGRLSWSAGPPGQPGNPNWNFNLTLDGNEAN